MAKYARYKCVQDVGLVTLVNPPLNALSKSMCDAIAGRIDEAVSDEKCVSIVLRVRSPEFAIPLPMNAKATAALRALADKIEGCSKPVVMALRGVVRGGAFELALAAHYRVMQEQGGALVLRDVELGLPPSAGGLQRLVRWSGVHVALRMAVGKQAFSARPALGMGMIDEMCEGELNDTAFAFAQKLTKASIRPVGTFRREGIDFAADHAFIQKVRAANSGLAETQIIDSVEAASLLPYEAGLLRDYDAHAACFNKPENIALMSYARGAATFKGSPEMVKAVNGRLRDALIRAGDVAVAVGARPNAVDAVVHGMGFVRGVYDTLSDEARAQIEEALAARAVKPTRPETIELRIIAALANEVMRLLEAGTITSSDEVDVILAQSKLMDKRHIGPMRRAKSVGPMAIRAELTKNARLGEEEFWTPHPMWDVLIRDDRSFADMRAPARD